MGRKAKTEDERIEEFIATAKPESLQRLYDLIGFSIRRDKILSAKKAKPPKEFPCTYCNGFGYLLNENGERRICSHCGNPKEDPQANLPGV